MYIIIKRDKSDHLKHKVHELKALACDVMECLEEAYADSRESETRDRRTRDDRYEPRGRRDEYEMDDYRDEVRGRGRGRY